MATESKAVDLGALQNNYRTMQASLRKMDVIVQDRKKKQDVAMQNYDASAVRRNDMQKELDKARQAMLDGARSVAQG